MEDPLLAMQAAIAAFIISSYKAIWRPHESSARSNSSHPDAQPSAAAELRPREFAFPCDTLVLFIRALHTIFRFVIARKHFEHFVDTPGHMSAYSRVEEHCIPNIEFVRWHRFRPLRG